MATFQLSESSLRLQFRIAPPETARRRTQRRILFVLDKSGSMEASFGELKAAMEYVHRQGMLHADSSIILYDETATEATLTDVRAARANGWTSFASAFATIKTVIARTPTGSTIDVVFMTDGRDNRTPNLRASLEELTFYIRNCRRTVVIHALGFTAEHDRAFLTSVQAVGTEPGVYRYAEAGGRQLEHNLTEMFDFLQTNTRWHVRHGAASLTIQMTRDDDGMLVADVLVPREMWVVEDADTIQLELRPDTPDAAPVMLELHRIPFDAMMQLREVEEMKLETPDDLQRAQALVTRINPFAGARHLRQPVMALRRQVQDKLDKYHAIFADLTRGMAPEGVAARLNSLRHEAVFAKARRARTVNQRTASNAAAFGDIDQQLQALPEVDLAPFAPMADMLRCPLSGDTILDVMRDRDDVMVWSARVQRAEHVIDAPSNLQFQRPLVGTYSFSAFQEGVRFAISTVGSAQSMGGFGELSAEAGVFRGPDGQLPNACLPLYLHEEHWRRVQVMLRPMLGYFFCLDPFAFKNDQYVALFAVLAQFLAAVSGEWDAWLLKDFTQLCRAVQPQAREVLQRGGFCGRARMDLATAFVENPRDRSSDVLPHLGAVLAWVYAERGGDDAEMTSWEELDAGVQKLAASFVGELWRRRLAAHFKTSPPLQKRLELERLLFGAREMGSVGAVPIELVEEGVEAGGEAEEADDVLQRLASTYEEEDASAPIASYAEYARYRLGLMSHRQMARYGPDWVLDPASVGEDDAAEAEELRRAKLASQPALYQVEVDRDAIAATIDSILAPVSASLEPMGRLLARVTGCDIASLPLELRWALLARALQDEEEAEDVYDAWRAGDAQRLLQQVAARLQQESLVQIDADVRAEVALRIARRIVYDRSVASFAGRLLRFCPTRGCTVFTHVVALICKEGVYASQRIPGLVTKVGALLTGCMTLQAGAREHVVLAHGLAWVACPLTTVRLLRHAVGRDAFARIEARMVGTWGHHYRDSDKPNRHGFHASNPNPSVNDIRFERFAV